MEKLNLVEKEKTVESVPLGQKAYYSKTITGADTAIFAGVTGDFQQLTINEKLAKEYGMERCPVQNELLASYTWPVSTQLVSPGAVTIGQELTFYKPAFIGDTITVVGEVNKKVPEKKFIYVQTTIYNQDDEILADGFALELMRVHS